MNQFHLNSLHAHNPQTGDLWLDAYSIRLFVVGSLTSDVIIICDHPVPITNQADGSVYWTWNVEEVKSITRKDFCSEVQLKSSEKEAYRMDVMPGKMIPYIKGVGLDVWLHSYRSLIN